MRGRSWFFVLSAALIAPAAHAQNAQVKKAEAAWEAYASGDADALEAARAAVDRAAAHNKTGGKGSVWVLKGKVYTALALQGGVPDADAIEAAVSAWEGAVERGAGEGAIAEDLSKILSATTLVIRDDLEGKRFDEAWQRVQAAMRGRALLDGVGWEDERLEDPLLQFAILAAVRAGHLDEARQWFTDWRAMDRFEPSVAVQVAAGLAEAEGADAGVEFLEPLLQERPLDTAMLTEVVEIRLAADQRDEAVRRVNKAAKARGAEGAAGSLLLGHLYRMVGEDDAARAAYERALERNPEASEAWLPLAELLLASADALKERIDSGELKRSERNEAETQREADLESAAELLEKAREAAGGSPGREVLEAMVRAYEALGRDEDKAAAEAALQELGE